MSYIWHARLIWEYSFFAPPPRTGGRRAYGRVCRACRGRERRGRAGCFPFCGSHQQPRCSPPRDRCRQPDSPAGHHWRQIIPPERERERERGEREMVGWLRDAHHLSLTVWAGTGRDEPKLWEHFFREGVHQVLLMLMNSEDFMQDPRNSLQALKLWERIMRFILKLPDEGQHKVFHVLIR